MKSNGVAKIPERSVTATPIRTSPKSNAILRPGFIYLLTVWPMDLLIALRALAISE